MKAAAARAAELKVRAKAAAEKLKSDSLAAAEKLKSESEKLTLTAAIHLDTIRKHAAQLEARSHRYLSDPNNTASDTTINTDLACISENLIQMKCRMSEIIASINEEMDGINSELMDLL